MEVIIFDSAAYRKLQEEQFLMFKKALREIKLEAEWLTLEEAQILLPYKSKTKWQELRDTGKVEFFQDGRLILYSRKSIINYIEKNKIK